MRHRHSSHSRNTQVNHSAPLDQPPPRNEDDSKRYDDALGFHNVPTNIAYGKNCRSSVSKHDDNNSEGGRCRIKIIDSLRAYDGIKIGRVKEFFGDVIIKL